MIDNYEIVIDRYNVLQIISINYWRNSIVLAT